MNTLFEVCRMVPDVTPALERTSTNLNSICAPFKEWRGWPESHKACLV